MYNIGEVFSVSIFGESHGEAIGLTISGIAPGLKLDEDAIKEALAQRRPKLKSETMRKEKDQYRIVSGCFNGYTTGTPLTFLIENKDVLSKSYDTLEETYRPSHADYPADMHYLGYNDYRGGGSFSGRLTVALVIAGSIANQILKTMNIEIETHIKSVMDLKDECFNEHAIKQIESIRNNKLNIINKDTEAKVLKLIEETREDQDSLGAELETIILNLEPGLGEPFYHKLDAKLAYHLMSIPSIKGVSFGKGFDFSKSYGSEVVDEYVYENDTIKALSNHNGGILGGLSSGMPVLVNTVVKPTPTLSKTLRSVNKNTKENIELTMKGRHDSSIFTRIPVVINSMCAITILDLYSIRYGYMVQRGQ